MREITCPGTCGAQHKLSVATGRRHQMGLIVEVPAISGQTPRVLAQRIQDQDTGDLGVNDRNMLQCHASFRHRSSWLVCIVQILLPNSGSR
jgi:hypothetical protein